MIKRVYRKAFVFMIILLFVGVSVAPVILLFNVIILSAISTFSEIIFTSGSIENVLNIASKTPVISINYFYIKRFKK